MNEANILETDERNKLWLNEMLPHELDAAIGRAPLAVLPIGSIEYHGPQNAFGVDINSIEPPIEAAVREAGGVLIPSMYWGGRAGHRLYPGSILVRTEVVRDLLVDIIEACRRMRFKAVLGVTGHMAPGHKIAIRQVNDLYQSDANMLIEIHAFAELVAKTGAAEGLDLGHGLCDHGAHNETSHMWASGDSRVDLSQLPAHDADVPFWGLEGTDPHAATREYGRRIQEATRRAVAAYCRDLLQRARQIPRPRVQPATLVVRFKSPAVQERWRRVDRGFILMVENGIRRRIPYRPGRTEYTVEDLYGGLWGVHCWGLQSPDGVAVGLSVAYQDVHLAPGRNEIEF